MALKRTRPGGTLALSAVQLVGLHGNRLLLGGWKAGADATFAKRFKVRHVVCCCADMPEQPWQETSQLCKRQLFPLPTVGAGSEDPPEEEYAAWKQVLEGAVVAIEEAACKEGRRVLVHDMWGQNQAAAVCVAWAVVHRGMPLATAVERVRKSNGKLGLETLTAPGVLRFLERFAEEHATSKGVEEKARVAQKWRLEKIAGSLEKGARRDPTLNKVFEVGKILADVQRFPADICEDTREILLEGLSLALGHPQESRHEVQAAVVEQVGEVLWGMQQKLTEATGVAKTEAEAAQESIAHKVRALDELAVALEAAQEEVLIRCVEVESAEAAALKALREVAEAMSGQRKARARSDGLAAERVRYAHGLEKEHQEVRSRVSLQAPGAEDAVRAALSGGQRRALFDGKLAALDAQIATADEDAAQAERRAAAAQERTECLRSLATAAGQRLREARAAEAEKGHQMWVGRRSMSFAGGALATLLVETEKVEAEVDTLAEAVAGFREVSFVVAARAGAEAER